MRKVAAVATGLLAAVSFTAAGTDEKIQDNSFLIEEAYNQEDGVIQHISTFQWDRSRRAWVYSFTQEWPTPRQKHQLSFMVPVAKTAPSGSGLGDIVLNYRYQAVLTERFAFAPRLSLVLSTGRWQDGYGKGGPALQASLPVSVDASRHVTVHFNTGATWTPRAAGAVGVCRTTVDTSAGASAVIHVSSTLDTFVECSAPVSSRCSPTAPSGARG